MTAIFKREFKSYFHGLTGYIFIALMLMFEGIYMTAINILSGYAAFEFSLENMMIVFLFIVPIITMRSFTEDRKNSTDKLLAFLPLKAHWVVLGKYFALLALLLIPTAIIGIYPVILNFFGNVNLSSSYACLIAMALLVSALISMCMFMSSISESQTVAAILSIGALLAIYISPTLAAMIPSNATASFIGILLIIGILITISYAITKSPLLSAVIGTLLLVPAILIFGFNRPLYEGLIPLLIKKLAIFDTYKIFAFSIFDIYTVFYYLAFIIFFIFLTILVMEKKKAA